MAGLKDYHRKRDFGRTPEPAGDEGKRRGGRVNALSFVVQKHAARRLHYDFRLELDGVLKSWAVPKGPSLVPGDKRLAVATEDHPLEYAGFEGVIPAGEYGGGTVLVWDRGTWTPVGDPHAGLAKGSLEFRLDGEKLRGRFRLIRLRSRSPKEKPSWLLIKATDDEARPADVPLVDARPESVLSGRDLRGVAAARDRVWRSNRRKDGAHPDPRAIPAARKGALPREPRAQLATLVSEAPDGDRWLHEIKLDGYRLLARIDKGRVALYTRNGNDWTDRFPGLAEALAGLPCRAALLDGEAVVIDAKGRSSFQALQTAIGEGRPDIQYFAFDLLHLDGYDLTESPLAARKAALKPLLADAGPLRYSDHVEGNGKSFFAEACRLGVEGVVSKQSDSRYVPGRSKAWLKVKCQQRQEMVIVGFTDPRGTRPSLGALLLAVHDDAAKLTYAGKVGTGFSAAVLADLRARLDRLEIRGKPPAVAGVPKALLRQAHWVRPQLVAEITFTEWTRDGHARHPVFMGLREDKPAAAVIRERAQAAPVATRLTHPDKVLYPEAGITKRDLADYYEAVQDLLLPGLVHRPLTLVRCPNGRTGHCFYQKHATGTIPAAIPRVSVNPDEEPYVYVEDIGSVIELVQLGVLELHVWGSRVEKLERPDLVVMDLDPDPTVSFDRVVATARRLDERLRGLGLRGFPRLTGGKGLHVVVPLAPRADWDQVKELTHLLARDLVREDPDGLTAVMSKSRRRGKIFVDYLRNARGATAIASYSTRAREGAPVAMPITWDDLDERAKEPPRFGLREARAWALAHPEPWPGFDDARRPLTAKLLASLR